MKLNSLSGFLKVGSLKRRRQITKPQILISRFFAVLILVAIGNSTVAFAQGNVRGVVSDSEGNPLPGVTVFVKNSSEGTITDDGGSYLLENVSSNDILVFSFIGMKTLEVPVGNQTVVDVTMEDDIIGLEEVVAIGYGTVRKSDLTGAVSMVSNEEIVKTPTNNAMEAVQGKITGVTISRESGAAGASVDIRVRGNRSINGSNSPLFIIDGVQGARFEDISASDIESINILKDASSTAIYGAQGANGVVIITTKKGHAGKVRVSYNAYYGINGLTKYPDVNLYDDYINLRREAYRTAGLWESSADDEAIFSEYEWNAIQDGNWVNWQDELLQNGHLNNHALTVSGGSDKAQSLLSLAYMNEGGMYANDNMDKYSIRYNLNYNVFDWLDVGVNSQVTYYDIDRRKDPIKLALYTSPFGEPYDENGNINLFPIGGNVGIYSPMADEIPGNAIDNRQSTNISMNGFIEMKPIEGLSYKSILALNMYTNRQGVYNSSNSITKLGGTSESSIRSSLSRYLNWDNIITYKKDFGDHSLTVTGLTSWINRVSEYVLASGTGQLLSSQSFYYLQGNTTESKQTESGFEGTASFSVAGRINYSYKGKYLLTASNRYDGASRLSTGNKWDSFPSVAVGWKISEETFMQNVEPVSNMKLRASYGFAGNSGISAYGTQSAMYMSTDFAFGDITAPYYKIVTYGNDSLGWERSKTLDVGVDLGLLKNRIYIVADVYKTETSGILLSRGLPMSTGGKGKSVFQNIGSTENTGIEIQLNTVNVNKGGFTWKTNLIFTKANEKITGLIDGEDIIYGGKQTSLIIGQPISTWYNYAFDGIWQSDEQEEMDLFNANGHRFEPGDIKVKDLRGPDDEDGNPTEADYRITAEDRIAVGSSVPDWEGGIGNTFEYKNFDFSFFIYARMGQTIWGEFLGRYNPDGQDNGPSSFDYWTPENPSNMYPRPDMNKGSIVDYTFSDMLMFADGSYVKLRNVSLGYTIPQRALDRLSLQRVRLYVTGSNLLTWVKDPRLKNYDPERGGSESSPLSRQLIFGVNIDF